MITGINAEIIGTSKFYKIDLLIFFVLNLVGVGLNFLLIPAYGLNGAACAVLASVFLYNTMRFIFIAIVMKIQPFTKKTFIAGLCAVFTYGILWMIPHINIPVIDIIFQTLCIGIILGSLILSLRVSEDISNSFYKVLARIRIPD
jgi:O-antigen/teichoic acid export membrane protein